MNTIRTLKANEIECRIGQISKTGTGLSLLLYKDARCDMAILDETFGPLNWKRRHTRENANCIVSIWDDDKKEWIEKEDTGTESNTEAAKGLASDAFKRACVNVGIGRELYTAPFIWIPSDKCNINGNKCNDKFEVKSIGYNENREINALEIVNLKTGKTVFKMGNANPKVMPDEPKNDKLDALEMAANAINRDALYCSDCRNELKAITAKDGSTLNPIDLRNISYKRFGRTLCPDCMNKAQKAKESA